MTPSNSICDVSLPGVFGLRPTSTLLFGRCYTWVVCPCDGATQRPTSVNFVSNELVPIAAASASHLVTERVEVSHLSSALDERVSTILTARRLSDHAASFVSFQTLGAIQRVVRCRAIAWSPTISLKVFQRGREWP